MTPRFYEDRHIKKNNPTAEELRKWHKISGLPLKKFFNTSGLLYKSMALKDKLPSMSEDEQYELLATDGMLVKRPLIISEDFVLVGFKGAEWEPGLNSLKKRRNRAYRPRPLLTFTTKSCTFVTILFAERLPRSPSLLTANSETSTL